MALGEDVSSIKTTLMLAGVSLTENLNPQQQVDIRSQYHKIDLNPAGLISSPLNGGSRLARGSAADLDSLNQGAGIFKGRNDTLQQDSTRQFDSLSKRKRVDSRSDTEHQSEYALRGGGFEKCGSRDQMPPPPIPTEQPFVYTARVPSSDLHSLNPQHNHFSAAHFPRAPIEPQRYPSKGVLSRSMLAPGSSMELSNRLFAGARINNGQSCVDHHQSPRNSTATAGPVYARGGRQPPPPESFDVERSRFYSSPSSSLPSTGLQPVRRSMGYHQGNLMFPIEVGDRTIDPSSRSHQSVSSNGSSPYHRRQSVLAMQSPHESEAQSRNHNLSSNREGRITLSRTASFASQQSSNKGIGLSSHVRSSSRHNSHQSVNSSSHRQQLVIATPAHQRTSASAHFPKPPPAYSSSLPALSGSDAENFRRNNSFDSGMIPVNGEMRPYSSNNGEVLLLAQDSRVAPTLDRARLTNPQALGPRRRANR